MKLNLPGEKALFYLLTGGHLSPKRLTTLQALSLAILVSTSSLTRADHVNNSFPIIDVSVLLEIQSDNTFDSDIPAAHISDHFNTTEIALGLYLTHLLSAHAALTFEPVLDTEPGEDRLFEDNGLYAEELYARLTFKGVSLIGGKFNPAFGKGWNAAPGIYGVDFTEDYEITERIGVGALIETGKEPWGQVTLTAATYFADTSALSESAFTSRGRTKLADGGASNTEGLDSHALTLDLASIPGLNNLVVHLGYRHQARGSTADDLADEKGYVAGLLGRHTLDNSRELEWIAEYVFLDNADATRDELTYLTLGAAVTINGTRNIAISYTGRSLDSAGGGTLEDKLFQISAGSVIRNDWTLDLGYRYSREEDAETHIIGLLLAREFGISRNLKR